MLKKYLVLGAALGFAAGSASAADLGPNRRTSIKDGPAPVVYQRPFSWTGLYLGVQIGYGDGTTGTQSGRQFSTEGSVGGGHAGYNWKSQNLVYGIETDLEVSGIGRNGASQDTDVRWIGSTRGRLGIAYERTMFYATAGWAYGDVKIDNAVSEVRNGWTAGAGVEYALNERTTARLEYRYTDLGTGSNAAANDVDFHAVRAGVSFKF